MAIRCSYEVNGTDIATNDTHTYSTAEVPDDRSTGARCTGRAVGDLDALNPHRSATADRPALRRRRGRVRRPTPTHSSTGADQSVAWRLGAAQISAVLGKLESTGPRRCRWGGINRLTVIVVE
jgi:hypothetical protein